MSGIPQQHQAGSHPFLGPAALEGEAGGGGDVPQMAQGMATGLGDLVRQDVRCQGLEFGGMVRRGGPDDTDAIARQGQVGQHAVRTKPLVGRAPVGPFRLEVGHYADVVVVLQVEADPGLVPQPGVGAVGSHQQAGLQVGAIGEMEGVSLVGPGDRFRRGGQHLDVWTVVPGLPQAPLQAVVLGDPGQFRQTRIQGVEGEAAAVVTVDAHPVNGLGPNGSLIGIVPGIEGLEPVHVARAVGIDAGVPGFAWGRRRAGFHQRHAVGGVAQGGHQGGTVETAPQDDDVCLIHHDWAPNIILRANRVFRGGSTSSAPRARPRP